MARVKTIGKSGQIVLGKQYAGHQILVDEVEPGVWVVKLTDTGELEKRILHDSAYKP